MDLLKNYGTSHPEDYHEVPEIFVKEFSKEDKGLSLSGIRCFDYVAGVYILKEKYENFSEKARRNWAIDDAVCDHYHKPKLFNKIAKGTRYPDKYMDTEYIVTETFFRIEESQEGDED